ncbi:DUF1800 family protein [Aeromicrobium sp. UC242_57]|uniref:DUF1800 family protein n=1 Tax=Aeromicrobium sp. UC242_57 TaxID=3374624 RepID=UPI0037B4F26F
MSQGLGQYLHSWPRPDGFPETSSTWTSPARVLRGWDIHYSLAGKWWSPKQYYTPARAKQLPTAWPRTLGQPSTTSRGCCWAARRRQTCARRSPRRSTAARPRSSDPPRKSATGPGP